MPFPTSTDATPCKHGHLSTRDRRGKCHECLRTRSRKRYAKDLEKSREKNRTRAREKRGDWRRAYERKYYHANPQRYMLKSAVDRAKKLGFACTITEADIVIPEFCPLLGLKLQRGTGKQRAASPSLDKIIPSLGYVPGNVWVISHRANELKRDATLEELQMLAYNFAKAVRKFPWEKV